MEEAIGPLMMLVMVGLFFGKAMGHGLGAGLPSMQNNFMSIIVAVGFIYFLVAQFGGL